MKRTADRASVRSRTLLSWRARSRKSAGFGAFGRPVFRRKGDAPELRARRGKFEADFGFVAADGTEENDATFLFFRGAFVLQMESGAAGEARLEQYERAVGVDGERLGFFVEGLALRVQAVEADGNLHENALAAALGSWRNGRAGHDDSLSWQNYFTRRGPISRKEPKRRFTKSSEAVLRFADG